MPLPGKEESKEEYIARFMSDESMKKKHPDSKQRLAIAYSEWNKAHSKEVYCSFPISVKEEGGELYTEGFISTTDPDRARDGEYDGEILSKNVQYQIAESINNGIATVDYIGSTRAVSLQHDWIKEGDPAKIPAGIAIPPVEVRETGKGGWGVYGTTHVNRLHPEFKQTEYNLKNGYLGGHSIEYYPGEFEPVKLNNKSYRFVKTINGFVGYAFAGIRKIANPSAIITGFSYKEIETAVTDAENPKELPITEAVKMETEVKQVEMPKIEVKEVEVPKIDIKEVVDKLKDSPEIKEAISSLKVEQKIVKGDVEDMNPRIKEMEESLEKGDIVKFKDVSARYMDEEDLFTKTLARPDHMSLPTNLRVKCDGKGLKIVSGLRIKGTLDTSSNTSAYTQQPVEFADLFAPGIIDTFNNQRVLFGFLRKEQHIGGSHYQWKMIVNRDPASNSSFVDQDDVSILKNYANKLNYQTPLKIGRRGISVTDFMQRYSARSNLGDLFQLEVTAQMNELMTDVNTALFAAVADGTGNSPLGLEAVADSAGYTTLYGYTRSTANRLAPAAVTDTYIASVTTLTEAVLRNGCTKVETEGALRGNLAIVCSPAVRDFMYNLLDGQRQFINSSADFGFSKFEVPHWDGIPIIVDPFCTSDSAFIIDTESDVIVIGMEPRVTGLAKVGAATEAYIEMHFAHVYKQPRRIHMLNGITGP